MRLKMIRSNMENLINDYFPLLRSVNIEVKRLDGNYFMTVKKKLLRNQFVLNIDKSSFDLPPTAMIGCLLRELCRIEYYLKHQFFWTHNHNKKTIEGMIENKNLEKYLQNFSKFSKKY